MELRQLEYVLAVAREGSFTRAAETLFLSQSSLSKQIHKLEVELGCPLFTRGRGDVALTEAGEQVVRAAPGILGTWNTLCASLARRELTLAVTPAFSHYALAGRVADFSRDHPEIRLQMAECENAEVPRLLTTGRAELAIFRLEGDRTPRTHVLCTDELALLLPRDHPCTKESAVSLTRFHRERVLLLGGGTGEYGRRSAPEGYVKRARRLSLRPFVVDHLLFVRALYTVSTIIRQLVRELPR